MKALIIVVTTSVVGGSFLLSRTHVVAPAALGTVKLEAGLKCVDFDTSAVPTSGDPDVKGHIKNETGRKVTDVTISVKPKIPAAGNPPLIVSATVNGGTANAGSGGATSITVNLSNAAHTIGIGELVEAQVNLGPPSGSPVTSEFKLCFTGSVSKSPSSAHFDWLGEYAFTSASGSQKITLDDTANDGQAGWVKNTDSSKTLTGFSGTFEFPTGSGVTVEGVSLEEGDGDPVSATVATDGVTFSVSTISLGAGTRYKFFVELSATPAAPAGLSISPTFGE